MSGGLSESDFINSSHAIRAQFPYSVYTFTEIFQYSTNIIYLKIYKERRFKFLVNSQLHEIISLSLLFIYIKDDQK